MTGNDALLEQNVKLLMLRERELLSLRRKQHRFEAWLSLAQSLAELVDSAPGRNRVLRQVTEVFKSKLFFQEVAFFSAAGRSLLPIHLDPDVECGAPLDDGAVNAVFRAKDGQGLAPDDVALQSPTRFHPFSFHRFLWYWIDAVDPPVLLVAGYDRERAEFYPPFDEADLAQFAMVGRELDLLLGNMAPLGRAEAAAIDGTALAPRLPDRGAPSWPHALTGRELEVSRLLARGKTNKEIGAVLGISSRTVQSHVANIFDKLGVHNRAGAVGWLVEHQVAV